MRRVVHVSECWVESLWQRIGSHEPLESAAGSSSPPEAPGMPARRVDSVGIDAMGQEGSRPLRAITGSVSHAVGLGPRSPILSCEFP